MATVTPPAPSVGEHKRGELRRQVSDPLERLRGYIRFYVSVEGTAAVLIAMPSGSSTLSEVPPASRVPKMS